MDSFFELIGETDDHDRYGKAGRERKVADNQAGQRNAFAGEERVLFDL